MKKILTIPSLSLIIAIAFMPKYAAVDSMTGIQSNTPHRRPAIRNANSSPPMQLRAETTFRTADFALPQGDSIESFCNFFKEQSNRHILLNDDGHSTPVTNPSRELQLTFQRKWAEQEHVDHDATVEEIVTAKGPGLKIFGVKIGCTLTYGAKLFLHSSSPREGISAKLPQYKFVLLETELDPRGSLAWILRYMDKAGAKYMQISSITHVTVELRPNNKFAFQSHAILSAKVMLPDWAIRIIPVSREKIVKVGNRSIQESLEHNIGPRLNRFQASFMENLNVAL